MDLLTLLGPFELPEGDAFTAVELRQDGQLASETERTPTGAIERRLARRGGREGLAVDVHHAALAARFGLPTATPTPAQLEQLARLTISLGGGPLHEKITDPELVTALIAQCRRFLAVEPWHCFESDEATRIEVRGVAGAERELSVLGSEGEQFGLAIYDRRGSVEAVLEEPGGPRDVPLDGCVLYLEDGPRFAVEVVERGLGLTRLPLFHALQGSRPVPIRPEQLRVLIASMGAIAGAIERRGAATETFLWRGKAVTVALTPGPDFDPDGARGGLPPPTPSPAHLLDEAVREKLAALDPVAAAVTGPLEASPLLERPWRFFLRRGEDGLTLAQRHDAALSPRERAWREAQEAAPARLLVVEERSPAEGVLWLRDRLTDELLRVRELAMTREAVRWDGLVGRVVAFEGEHVIVGAGRSTLSVPQTSRLAARARALVAGGPLLGEEGLLALVRLVDEVASIAGPQRFETTDGEPYASITDRFELSCAPEEAARAIEALPRAGLATVTGGEREWVFTRPGNVAHLAWPNTCLSTVRLVERRLEVECGSSARADRHRALLEGALGAKVKFCGRTEEPIREVPALADGPIQLDACRTARPELLQQLGALELLAKLLEEQAEQGKTKPEALAKVHEALCEVERASARGEQEAMAPPLLLRRVLGVSSDGRFVGVDRELAWRGGGLSLSDNLLALASAAQEPLERAGHGEREAIQLAVDAWHATRGFAPKGADERLCAQALRTYGPEVEEAVRWMLAVIRGLLRWDQRVLGEWSIDDGPEGTRVDVKWRVEHTNFGNVRPLIALDRECEAEPDGWAITPPSWRHELIAQVHREFELPLGVDFAAHVARHVELEELMQDRPPKVLEETIRRLSGTRGLTHAALDRVVEALVAHPALKLSRRPGAALRALLEGLQR